MAQIVGIYECLRLSRGMPKNIHVESRLTPSGADINSSCW